MRKGYANDYHRLSLLSPAIIFILENASVSWPQYGSQTTGLAIDQ
jgi:hypothetical protein